MSKEQIIDEAYENYLNVWTFEKHPNDGSVYSIEPIKVKEHTKEQFVYRCKTDSEFSEKWGLKIEERELSLEERVDIFNKKREYGEVILPEFKSVGDMNAWTNKLLVEVIPTKLITLTYNNETIESYE